MFDWSDVRYVLAVVDCGSTIAAARKLEVNQSTVHRRIMAIEASFGQALFIRTPAGHTLTDFGELMVPFMRQLEKAAEAVARQVASYHADLSGSIRLTCPEPIVARLHDSGLLQDFHDRYPSLRVELVMSDRYLDLAKGEADIALRSGDPADEGLLGRKVGDSIWAVYASQGYVQKFGRPQSIEDLNHHTMVAYDGMLANHRAARWIASVAPNARVGTRNTSVLGVLHAVKSGIGLAPLPTTIASMHDDLVQILPPVAELSRGWYLLTHPDQRKTPRISAFVDFIVENLDRLRPVLMG